MPAPSARLAIALLHGLLAAAAVLSIVTLGVVSAAGFERWEWPLVPVAACLTGAFSWWRARAVLSPPLAVAAVAGTTALLIVAFTPLAGALLRPLRRADPTPAKVDAVVVLSASVDDAGHLNATALDRLLHGAELLRRGVAPIIVVSRVRSGDAGTTSDADQERILSLLGRPVRRARVDSVRNTRDEATRIAAWARPLGVRHIALVTSPAHSRRACATFEVVGLRVSCLPSRGRDAPPDHLDRAEYRTRAFRAWLYETLGMMEYRARGWVR